MGAGSVGGYFGARLAAAGNEVTFIARGAHLDAMRTNGLRLDSDIGHLHLKPTNAVSDATQVPEADAIIFAVKMRDTEIAARSLRDLAAKGATVFTFQNGVESAERVGNIVGRDKVVEGAARIGASISEPGVVKQIGNFARLEFGDPDGAHRTPTRAFHQACVEAGIDAALSDNISRTIWLKFAMLAPMAGMTALTRGPIGPVRDTPSSRELLRAAVDETVAVGMALGTGLEPGDAARTMRLLDGLPKAMMASMCHDLLAGKPIEIDGLSGAVARLAQSSGVAAPTHAFIAAALSPFTNGRPSD
jgi:2-dehydropantoate 2-reductase